MSLDEAHLILNVKKEDPLEIIEKVCHLGFQPLFEGRKQEGSQDSAD
jgi:hypothetical protein